MSKTNQKIHEEILDLVENSRGELMQQVLKITNAKNERLGLKFATINAYYHEMLKTYNARDIQFVGMPMDGGNCVTLKTLKHTNDDLKHSDEDYYSSHSVPQDVKDRIQGVYYSVTVTVMITRKK